MSEEIEKMAEESLGDFEGGRIEMSMSVYKDNLKLQFKKGYEKATEWISVKDRLPVIGVEVLLYNPIDGIFTVGELLKHGWAYDFQMDEPPTHWQPLPPAPKQK